MENTEMLNDYLLKNNRLVNWKNIPLYINNRNKEKSLSKLQNELLDEEIQNLVKSKTIVFKYRFGNVENPNVWDIYLNVGSVVESPTKYLGELKILMSRSGISFHYKKSKWFEEIIENIHNNNSTNDRNILVLNEVIIESIKSKIPHFIGFINSSTKGNLDKKGDYKLYSSFSKYFNRSLIFGIYNTKTEYHIYRGYLMGKFGLDTFQKFRKWVNDLKFNFNGLDIIHPQMFLNKN